jgi:hypothetical protein
VDHTTAGGARTSTRTSVRGGTVSSPVTDARESLAWRTIGRGHPVERAASSDAARARGTWGGVGSHARPGDETQYERYRMLQQAVAFGLVQSESPQKQEPPRERWQDCSCSPLGMLLSGRCVAWIREGFSGRWHEFRSF